MWQSNNMQTLASLRGFHEMGVAAMGFNKDGTKLASVGLDQDHSIAIWDWRKAVRLATCPGHTDKIFEARFKLCIRLPTLTARLKKKRFQRWRGSAQGLPSVKGSETP